MCNPPQAGLQHHPWGKAKTDPENPVYAGTGAKGQHPNGGTLRWPEEAPLDRPGDDLEPADSVSGRAHDGPGQFFVYAVYFVAEAAGPGGKDDCLYDSHAVGAVVRDVWSAVHDHVGALLLPGAGAGAGAVPGQFGVQLSQLSQSGGFQWVVFIVVLLSFFSWSLFWQNVSLLGVIEQLIILFILFYQTLKIMPFYMNFYKKIILLKQIILILKTIENKKLRRLKPISDIMIIW